MYPNVKYSGWTPLHRASLNNRIAAVKLLLEAGASVNIQNRRYETALGIARERHYDDLVALLETRMLRYCFHHFLSGTEIKQKHPTPTKGPRTADAFSSQFASSECGKTSKMDIIHARNSNSNGRETSSISVTASTSVAVTSTQVDTLTMEITKLKTKLERKRCKLAAERMERAKLEQALLQLDRAIQSTELAASAFESTFESLKPVTNNPRETSVESEW